MPLAVSSNDFRLAAPIALATASSDVLPSWAWPARGNSSRITVTIDASVLRMGWSPCSGVPDLSLTSGPMSSRGTLRSAEEDLMALAPRDYAGELLAEARETHPWLHHRLFRAICAGELSRDQVRNVVREQGAFFLDTLRHAAWKIISVGGSIPTFEDLERQRALIPLVVEEGGHDTIGGKTTAHSFLFIKLAAALGISRDELFARSEEHTSE